MADLSVGLSEAFLDAFFEFCNWVGTGKEDQRCINEMMVAVGRTPVEDTLPIPPPYVLADTGERFETTGELQAAIDSTPVEEAAETPEEEAAEAPAEEAPKDEPAPAEEEGSAPIVDPTLA